MSSNKRPINASRKKYPAPSRDPFFSGSTGTPPLVNSMFSSASTLRCVSEPVRLPRLSEPCTLVCAKSHRQANKTKYRVSSMPLATVNSSCSEKDVYASSTTGRNAQDITDASSISSQADTDLDGVMPSFELLPSPFYLKICPDTPSTKDGIVLDATNSASEKASNDIVCDPSFEESALDIGFKNPCERQADEVVGIVQLSQEMAMSGVNCDNPAANSRRKETGCISQELLDVTCYTQNNVHSGRDYDSFVGSGEILGKVEQVNNDSSLSDHNLETRAEQFLKIQCLDDENSYKDADRLILPVIKENNRERVIKDLIIPFNAPDAKCFCCCERFKDSVTRQQVQISELEDERACIWICRNIGTHCKAYFCIDCALEWASHEIARFRPPTCPECSHRWNITALCDQARVCDPTNTHPLIARPPLDKLTSATDHTGFLQAGMKYLREVHKHDVNVRHPDIYFYWLKQLHLDTGWAFEAGIRERDIMTRAWILSSTFNFDETDGLERKTKSYAIGRQKSDMAVKEQYTQNTRADIMPQKQDSPKEPRPKLPTLRTDLAPRRRWPLRGSSNNRLSFAFPNSTVSASVGIAHPISAIEPRIITSSDDNLSDADHNPHQASDCNRQTLRSVRTEPALAMPTIQHSQEKTQSIQNTNNNTGVQPFLVMLESLRNKFTQHDVQFSVHATNDMKTKSISAKLPQKPAETNYVSKQCEPNKASKRSSLRLFTSIPVQLTRKLRKRTSFMISKTEHPAPRAFESSLPGSLRATSASSIKINTLSTDSDPLFRTQTPGRTEAPPSDARTPTAAPGPPSEQFEQETKRIDPLVISSLVDPNRQALQAFETGDNHPNYVIYSEDSLPLQNVQQSQQKSASSFTSFINSSGTLSCKTNTSTLEDSLDATTADGLEGQQMIDKVLISDKLKDEKLAIVLISAESGEYHNPSGRSQVLTKKLGEVTENDDERDLWSQSCAAAKTPTQKTYYRYHPIPAIEPKTSQAKLKKPLMDALGESKLIDSKVKGWRKLFARK
nr:hypothetical protein L204_04315 [Cryptococcus depauperatus CBS 7855]